MHSGPQQPLAAATGVTTPSPQMTSNPRSPANDNASSHSHMSPPTSPPIVHGGHASNPSFIGNANPGPAPQVVYVFTPVPCPPGMMAAAPQQVQHVRIGNQPQMAHAQHPPTAPPYFYGAPHAAGSPQSGATSPVWEPFANRGTPSPGRQQQQPRMQSPTNVAHGAPASFQQPTALQRQQEQANAFAQQLNYMSGASTPPVAPPSGKLRGAAEATPSFAQPTAAASGASTGVQNRAPADPLASTQAPHAAAKPSAKASRRAEGGGGEGAGPELDLDSTLNDMTLRTATATIASLEDFLSGVPAATEDPQARKIIDDLRKEVTDKVIRSKVMRLPKETCEALVAVLEGDTHLLMVQCTKERGNVIAPLVEKLGPETTFTIIRFLLDHYTDAATSMGGCIAIPRILPHVKPSQLDVFFDATMAAFDDLVSHQYGNFVVKHFAGIARFSEAMSTAHFADAEKVAAFAVTKSGSHVVEELLTNATPEAVRVVCRTMLTTSPEALKRLAHDKFGNYCVQAAFRALTDRVEDAQLHAECAQMTSKCARDSPFAQNIMKRVAHGYRKYKRGSSGGAATGVSDGPSPAASPSPAVAVSVTPMGASAPSPTPQQQPGTRQRFASSGNYRPEAGRGGYQQQGGAARGRGGRGGGGRGGSAGGTSRGPASPKHSSPMQGDVPLAVRSVTR